MFSEGNNLDRELQEHPTSDVEVVRLSEDSWQILKELKLRALEQEPVAFEDPDEGHQKYLERSEEEWRAILAGQPTETRPFYNMQVFAQSGSGEYVGMVSSKLPLDDGKPRQATVQQMFVDNNYRGQGIGRQLLIGLLEDLRNTDNVSGADLEVVSTQTPAINLYKSLGFTEMEHTHGTAERGDEVYDEIKMVLSFE